MIKNKDIVKSELKLLGTEPVGGTEVLMPLDSYTMKLD